MYQNQRVIYVSREFGVSIVTACNIIRNLLVCLPDAFSEVDRISRKIINSQKISSLIEDQIAKNSSSFYMTRCMQAFYKSFGIRLKRVNVLFIMKKSLIYHTRKENYFLLDFRRRNKIY